MSSRSARRLTWGITGLTGAVAAAAVVFLSLSWREPLPPGTFGFRGFTFLFVAMFGAVGALLALKHPENPIGWIFCVGALLSGLQELAQDYALYGVSRPGTPLVDVAAWIPAWIWVPGTGILVFVLLLFPNGHLLSPRWRWVAWLGGVGIGCASVGLALAPGPLENFETLRNPFGVDELEVLGRNGDVGLIVYAVPVLLAAASIVMRFRRSFGEEREQLKWLVASGVSVAIVLTASFVGEGVIAGATAYLWLSVAVIAAFMSIPVAIGVAVLKYRLYDIDIVINKAVVYSILAIFITAVYVGVVIGVGAAAGSGGDALLSAVAAAVVALAFQPVRRAAQRLANRLVYGKRATPYEVLSGFSERLGEAYSVDDVLPRMARILAEGTGAERVGVWLMVGSDLEPAATWPPVSTNTGDARLGEDRSFEVRHQGELLGAIRVTMPVSEPMTPTQERLVEDVASQAGLVLRNAGLVADLRASRQRLVAAQDEERRRIERNIHDGAQQQLIGLSVKQRLAASLVGKDDDRLRALLDELQRESQQALDDLRDLARGIYPPLLGDKGLGDAIEAQARRSPVAVEVERDGIGRYPQEIEAAAYFSILEALQNVAKYARASAATVRVTEADGVLEFRVTDDGVGFDPAVAARGTGLQGMADRLAALGGRIEVRSSPGAGTTITGRVPVGGSS